MIIRLLPTQEYAFYTLANTMLGTMLVLSDSGISNGVMAKGGEVWKTKSELGKVISTGLSLRNKFAAFSLLVSLPILFFLLLRNGAGYLVATFIALALVPAFYTTLSGSIFEIPAKLHQDIIKLQKLQLANNVGRLILLALSILLLPLAGVAILATSIMQALSNIKLKNITEPYTDYHQSTDKEIKNSLLVFVRKTLPMVIYYCISGQLTIWLVSMIGSTTSIAQAGALGRLAIMLNLVAGLCSILVIPRFARMPNDLANITSKYFQILLGLLFICIFITFSAWLFSTPILHLLGNKYLGLNDELVLCISSACIGLIATQASNLTTSRGWLLNPFVSIILNVSTTVIFLITTDLSSLINLYKMNLAFSLIQLSINVSYGVYKLKFSKEANNSMIHKDI
ncbi:polysaccharide biosynthesis protein [Sabulibacter ruber]|uniref:polysaccharide biosynthesis protein n=1 Tax=Sabulibacter ruber TaxID=2811901 RepID=UPI001A95ADA6|nr:polysaccharide biosynthesis protein [Sabulibacter ruber]